MPRVRGNWWFVPPTSVRMYIKYLIVSLILEGVEVQIFLQPNPSILAKAQPRWTLLTSCYN